MTRRRPHLIVLDVLPLARATLAVAFVLFLTRQASAQAFVPPAGEGNVTVAYQDLFTRGHLDLNGERMAGPSGTDRTRGHAMTLGVEFGVTDRLAVYAALPYIRSRYEGSTPHLVGGVGAPQDWDDGESHGTWQDFHLGFRFNILARPVAVTAFAERVVPSHQYPALAHAAVGKDMLALTVGGAVGGFLDGVLPGLFFQSQYSYTRTADIVDIRPNRSRVDAEVGYFLTPRLALRFLESYQLTHDGFDLIGFLPMTNALFHSSGEEIPASLRRYHDQLQRSNFLSLGAGVDFALNESLEVFVAGANTVWGENVHPLRGVTIGANMHFRARKPSRP